MKIEGYITKEVKDFEGVYRISEKGKLYRYRKTLGEWKSIGTQHTNGYITARLSIRTKNKNHSRNTSIHRLVAEAFIDNPEGKEQVDHINENKTDNRVENLRWATPKENIEFYNTRDGRDHHTGLRKRHKTKIKGMISTLRKERAVNLIIEQRIDRLLGVLEEEQMKFSLHVEDEEKRLQVQYDNYRGYRNTTGKKYNSVKDMVKATGKSIVVNGKEFISCGSAAQYIVDNTEGKKKSTISKELRRYLQGKRTSWLMYGEFTIGY